MTEARGLPTGEEFDASGLDRRPSHSVHLQMYIHVHTCVLQVCMRCSPIAANGTRIFEDKRIAAPS